MKRFLAASSLLALALSACTPAGSSTIKIGFIGPLTGDAASYGTDTLNAMKMKVDEVNAAGGINGKQVEIVAEDGRCNGSDSTAAAQKLVTIDKVVAINGGQCSSETLAAAAVTNPAQVVTISGVSSSPDVTNAGDFVFRTMPSDAYKGKAIAAYIKNQHWTKIAILTENTDYAVGIRNVIVDAMGADNVVFNETVEQGTKDFRTLVTRMKDLKFDVFIPDAQSDAVMAAMMQQFRDQGLTQPAVSQDVADSATLGQIAKTAVEGIVFINTSSKLGEGGTDSFATRYRAKYAEPQANLSFATLSYDATGILIDAMKNGATDGPAIRDYMYGLKEYDGAAGKFHFDKNGDVVGIGYALKQFKDGKIVEVQAIPLE